LSAFILVAAGVEQAEDFLRIGKWLVVSSFVAKKLDVPKQIKR
jgi:hypothetical protein